MIVPDANLILYAHNVADPEHDAARAWWEGLLRGAEPVGIPIVVVLAFHRLATSPRVLREPLGAAECVRRIEAWFSAPAVTLLNPGRDHMRVFLDLVQRAGVVGNLTTDAEIAALAIEHHAVVHSSDHDFARFPGLRWLNPLSASKKKPMD